MTALSIQDGPELKKETDHQLVDDFSFENVDKLVIIQTS